MEYINILKNEELLEAAMRIKNELKKGEYDEFIYKYVTDSVSDGAYDEIRKGLGEDAYNILKSSNVNIKFMCIKNIFCRSLYIEDDAIFCDVTFDTFFKGWNEGYYLSVDDCGDGEDLDKLNKIAQGTLRYVDEDNKEIYWDDFDEFVRWIELPKDALKHICLYR